jgi:hypothetical protein
MMDDRVEQTSTTTTTIWKEANFARTIQGTIWAGSTRELNPYKAQFNSLRAVLSPKTMGYSKHGNAAAYSGSNSLPLRLPSVPQAHLLHPRDDHNVLDAQFRVSKHEIRRHQRALSVGLFARNDGWNHAIFSSASDHS